MICAGPRPNKLLIVGEAPGENEIHRGIPFVGASGRLLRDLFQENGIDLSSARITNVCHVRPPGNKISHFFLTKTAAKKEGVEEYLGRYPKEPIRAGIELLKEEIQETNPYLIVAVGDTALWALTGESGITKWRGSVMESIYRRPDGTPYKVIPILHPALVLRQWEWIEWVRHDIKMRIRPELSSPAIPQPTYKFHIRPSAADCVEWANGILSRLKQEELWLACDIETFRPYISCIGFAWSKDEAICIPFLYRDRGEYFSEEEELLIVKLLRCILTHPNARIIGQNFNYDRQYLSYWWGIRPRLDWDTSVTQNLLLPGTPKALDFLSSIYCSYHRYWKDESKEQNATVPDEQYWRYNCKDCCVTYEVRFEQEKLLAREDRLTDLHAFQHRQNERCFNVWLKGIRWDAARCLRFASYIEFEIEKRERWLEKIVGRNVGTKRYKAPWYTSDTQMKILFYDEMKLRKVLHPKTKKPTTDQNALQQLAKQDPILLPITRALIELSSLRQFEQTYIRAKIYSDGRVRTMLKADGTETFRLSSSKDAFNMGINLQNITKGNKLKEED